MYEIEKNVPVAEPWGGYRYPFKQMEIGDSFFIPADGDLKKTKSSMASRATRYGARTGKRFVVRNVNGGIRVWRVAPKPELVAAE